MINEAASILISIILLLVGIGMWRGIETDKATVNSKIREDIELSKQMQGYYTTFSITEDTVYTGVEVFNILFKAMQEDENITVKYTNAGGGSYTAEQLANDYKTATDAAKKTFFVDIKKNIIEKPIVIKNSTQYEYNKTPKLYKSKIVMDPIRTHIIANIEFKEINEADYEI